MIGLHLFQDLEDLINVETCLNGGNVSWYIVLLFTKFVLDAVVLTASYRLLIVVAHMIKLVNL